MDVAVQAPPTATVNQLNDGVDLQDCVGNRFSDKMPGMLPDLRR